MADGVQLHDSLGKLQELCSNSLRDSYSGVFEIADYESEVRIEKFKIVDLI